MAQRGGTVISHLKVGAFASPLINPGQADGLIALKAENLVQHHGYLQSGGWAAVNAPTPLKMPAEFQQCCLDADRMVAESGDTRSLNLIMLGFTLACARHGGFARNDLYCTLADVAAVLESRLEERPDRLQAALRALYAAENAV
jgi:indolepyruvate ferredoxin oxidoreductase beta subunit